ncbi:Ribonuclease H domain [Macleaya cordata]|uniref:Ribonuclease H domain n=1 Tax=Macleaya cordata TaxID=56857 RepID=A0A200R2Y1_MACCD|nr:Ribonuclease H domain [Macleaya cordata]
MWKTTLTRPNVIASSSQAISVEVGNSIITGIHAHVLTANRRALWDHLQTISMLNKPWLLIGDFNAVLRMEEKKGGLPPKSIAMTEFWDCVQSCNLIESHSTGIKYTWCNNQVGSRRILCKLDRAFFNTLWSDSYATNPATRFAYKLKRLKDYLKWWNINIFGNINLKLKDLEKAIDQAMLESDNDPADLDKLSKLITTQRDLDQGRSWSSQSDIKEHIVHHYETKFKSIPIYNMAIYKWPKAVIWACERIMRNFLWTGDPASKKLITKAWHKLCCPKDEGGLGLTKLENINRALLLKLVWRITSHKDHWASFLKAKFQSRTSNWISYYKQSSILGSLKWAIQGMEKKFGWIVGDGKDISLWHDAWCSTEPIADLISNNGSSFDHLARVSDIIANGQWSIPSTIADKFRLANINTSTIPPPLLGEDIRVWKPSLTGCYSVANGVHREKFLKIQWSKWIWRKCIHPSRSANIWKILSGCCATDKRLQDRGINIASRCSLCLKNIEDDTHLFWICSFAATIWSWIHELFGFQWNPYVQNFETVTAHATTRSAAIRDLWAAAITNVLTEIWHHRNSCIFNNIPASSRRVKSKILANFFECSILMKSTMHNRVEDLMIFKNLQINPRPAKPTRVLQCFWSLPDLDQLRIGCDGCSRGNPGPSGAGVILCDHTGNTIGAMSAGLGICTNFVAELLAVILGLEWASDRGW